MSEPGASSEAFRRKACFILFWPSQNTTGSVTMGELISQNLIFLEKLWLQEESVTYIIAKAKWVLSLSAFPLHNLNNILQALCLQCNMICQTIASFQRECGCIWPGKNVMWTEILHCELLMFLIFCPEWSPVLVQFNHRIRHLAL